MTAAKRARQKANRSAAGRHAGFDHKEGERCLICHPLPEKKEERPPGWRTIE